MYYHGSQARITELAERGDLCLTTDESIAASYARYDTTTGGHIHHITGQLWLADDEELREAAAEVYGREIGEEEHAFLLADKADVRAHLAAQDYDGVEYDDHDISGDEHTCIRVWRTDVLTITHIEQIED